MNRQQSCRAFTLIELLVVIAIIGVLAAIVAPTLGSFTKGDAVAAATSQLLGGVARARQLAISQRTEVYMVFLPTNYYAWVTDWNSLSVSEKTALTNLADKPLTAYTFVSSRTVGDQPGQSSFRYLDRWHQLPQGVYIPPEKFEARNPADPNPTPVYTITDPATGDQHPIHGFVWHQVHFPTERSPRVWLPCIVFDPQGRIVGRPGNFDGENIPLAQGSVSVPRDPKTKRLVLGLADAEERPPGSSRSTGFNVVHVDWLTGRGQLHRMEMR